MLTMTLILPGPISRYMKPMINKPTPIFPPKLVSWDKLSINIMSI